MDKSDIDYSHLFDHWGSILIKPYYATRSLLTQPYGDHLKEARELAERIHCHLRVESPAPWHPMATLYVFHPLFGDDVPLF